MMRVRTTIGLLLAAMPLAAAGGEPSDDTAARQRLMESMRDSCRWFTREDQWRELDACHRIWFEAHEKDVWRLNVNPHAAPPPGPSS